MVDYSLSREKMIREHLAGRGIKDPAVLEAFRTVPRERFVWGPDRAEAYADMPLRIASNQTISQPYMVALMLEHLASRPGDRVLEVGTGSGYQTALLSALGARVYTVERLADLLDSARDRLEELGYRGVRYRAGDGTLGWPEEAPFDRVVVSAGAPAFPETLAAQLAEGGRLVVPVGPADEQALVIGEKVSGVVRRREGEGCRFVKLIGREGWPLESSGEGRA
jgi:protein-L-isoaspartate(D-aspartate) O-methyltransferase